jgi:hypothetical protein
MTPSARVIRRDPARTSRAAEKDEETRTQFLKPYPKRTCRTASEADVSLGKPISQIARKPKAAIGGLGQIADRFGQTM